MVSTETSLCVDGVEKLILAWKSCSSGSLGGSLRDCVDIVVVLDASDGEAGIIVGVVFICWNLETRPCRSGAGNVEGIGNAP